MSQKEDGLRSVVKAILAIVLAIAFGPWMFMIIAAWILEPRTGSWGALPHVVGFSWLLLVAAAAAAWFLRTR